MPQIPATEAPKLTAQMVEARPNQMVCGRVITLNPPFLNTAVHQGREIVFCTCFCLEAFEADPDRFYAAHSSTKERSWA